MRSWPGATLSDRRRHQPRPARPGSASGAGGAARVRAGVVDTRARLLAGDQSRARAAGDPRCGELHRRRPALLDGSRRRAEHAQPRRRRARAPPGTICPAVQAAGRPRALRRSRGRRGATARRRARAGGQGGAAPCARGPARRVRDDARARAGARGGGSGAGVVRRDRQRRHRDHGRLRRAGLRARGVLGAARSAARGDPLGGSRVAAGGGCRRHRAQRRARSCPTPRCSCSAGSRRPRG